MEQEETSVLIFVSNYIPAIGGAEIAVKEITDRIEIDEVTFHMITPRYERSREKVERIGNVTVHRIGIGHWIDKFLAPFIGALKAHQLTVRNDVDMFWCIEPSFASGAAYIYNLLRFWDRIPIVLTQQSGQSAERVKRGRGGIINLSWRAALRFTDRVTAISEYLKERTREFGYEGPIDVIPNGVDIELFSKEYPDETLGSLKEELGKHKSTRYIITTSRLVEKNGIDIIIRALRDLPEYVELLVIGGGPLEQDLKDLARDIGVRDRVQFIGLVPHQEIPRYLSIADVFVRPSRSEGMGNSFIEAMAAGVPIVATEVGGITDFLTDRKTGMAVPVDDPEAVARSVNILLRDLTLREEIAIEAKDLVQRQYSWKRIAEDMKEVLTKYK